MATPKQLRNEQALTIYAFFLCVLIFSVACARWWLACCDKTPRTPLSSVGRARESCRQALLRVAGKLDRRTTWAWFGRPSFGLVALVGTYLVVNVVLCSNLLASHAVNHFASRYGWMGAGNMALCVFFGLKNTPLGFIPTVSHANINILHRIVGYVAVLLIVLHAVVYTFHLGRQGRWAKLLETSDLAGIGAGLSMLSLLVIGLYRHRHYEFFYASHIAGFAGAVILAFLHRPDWAKKLPYAMSFIACIWVLDRIVRGARVVRNLFNNQATIYPLPGGGIKVLLKKLSVEGAPGSYIYLWIPGLRLFQTHPFTVVGNSPSGLELVVKSHNGFTKALGDLARNHPGSARWVSIDGPYGQPPDLRVYDKLIFIAGGSGAAFTFGLMNQILRYPEKLASQSIDFVWAVKHTEHLSWFGQHLQNLTKPGSSANVTLHITDEQSGQDVVVLRDIPKYEGDIEIGEVEPLLSGHTHQSVEPVRGANIEFQKLDAKASVRNALAVAEPHQRVVLATCGPKSLMDAVRDAVHDYQERTGHIIDVLFEDYSGS